MNKSVYIPDDVYQGGKRLARKNKYSFSQLVSDALREYLAHHSPEEVTPAVNTAIAKARDAQDPFVSSAARRVLEQSEW
jgi:hypothetical protein